jgi:hypothetical protein
MYTYTLKLTLAFADTAREVKFVASVQKLYPFIGWSSCDGIFNFSWLCADFSNLGIVPAIHNLAKQQATSIRSLEFLLE